VKRLENFYDFHRKLSEEMKGGSLKKGRGRDLKKKGGGIHAPIGAEKVRGESPLYKKAFERTWEEGAQGV